MNNRQKTLAKIDEITDKHCTPCDYSSGDNSFCNTQCKIGAEIQALGAKLSGSRDDKIKKTLDKGQEITTNDVIYLNNNGINRSEIIKALKIDRTEGSKILNELLNNSKDSNRNLITDSEEMNMHSVNFKKTVKLDEEGMTMQQISKATGLQISTVSSYLYINNKAERIKNLNKEKVVDEEVSKEISTMDKIMNLSNKGIKPKEIAEKLDIKIQTVYQERSKYNKLQGESVLTEEEHKNEVKVKTSEIDNKTDDEVREKNEFMRGKLSQISKDMLVKINNEKELENKLEKLQEKYDQLSDDHNLLVNENKQPKTHDNEKERKVSSLEIHLQASKEANSELNEHCHRLSNEVDDLKTRNAELISESENLIKTLEDNLAAERKKHETLFQYVTL